MSTCFVAPSLNYLMRLLHIIDISKLHTRCIIEAIPFTKYKAWIIDLGLKADHLK